jgi:16S rRNA processing protein RimM
LPKRGTPPSPSPAASPARGRILLGRIAGAHGIRGEVLIHSYASVPEDIGTHGALSDAAGTRTFEIESARATAKGVVARLAGIADRTAAEALKGTELYVDRDRLPQAAEDEFYHADLVGLAAVDPDGNPIGTIVAVQNFGAGDLLELRLAGSSRTEFVPFTETAVPSIDLATRRAVVILPQATDEEE